MTNSEKFKEIFGFEVQEGDCVIPAKVCVQQSGCVNCPFNDWWSREYKECFELKEEYE